MRARALIGYDLLKGPFSGLVKDAAKVQNLLDQAKSLADSLSIAFNTTSGVPQPTVYLNPTRRHGNSSSNNIAEVGTLILEWTRLSDLSGDGKYAQLAEKAESYLLRPTGSPEAFPGMVGGDVSIADGKFINSDGGWSGGTDSFYEYLIKMYVYDPAKYGEYKDRWVLAADSTIKYLASHPTSRKDLTFLSQYSGQKTIPVSTHRKFNHSVFPLGSALPSPLSVHPSAPFPSSPLRRTWLRRRRTAACVRQATSALLLKTPGG